MDASARGRLLFKLADLIDRDVKYITVGFHFIIILSKIVVIIVVIYSLIIIIFNIKAPAEWL